MSVHGEESDEGRQEMANLPSQSLNGDAILHEANLEMESHFEII